MEIEKILVDDKEYEYVLTSDDAIEINDIDMGDTVDLTGVINDIQNNNFVGENGE